MRHMRNKQMGISMVEVLVTLVILLVGLLGLAGLQMQGLRSEMESYQRVQAMILIQDMVGRINANRNNAADYVAAGTSVGTATLEDCTTKAIGQPRDICEWNRALQGAGTTQASTSVGAIIGGRGCITQVATNIYQVSVAWQGMGKTFAPTNTCGQGAYGSDETLRRVISLTIRIADLTA